jgi:ATP-dependent DNA helicase RecQ
MVYEFFVRLSKMGVIKYIPGKRSAMLVFLEERLPDKSIYISAENYGHRKERFEKRLNSMLHYAFSMEKCRSEILLNYFGQEDTTPCGHCDYCKNKEQVLTPEDQQKLKKEILQHLILEPLLPDELQRQINTKPEFLSIVVRLLLDEEQIRYNEDGKIEILQADKPSSL